MAQETRTVCDCCGKETKGFSDKGWADPSYSELARNNWDVRVFSFWLESGDDGSRKLEKEYSFESDACFDCMRELRGALLAAVEKIKARAVISNA